jgi:hypothetical protein
MSIQSFFGQTAGLLSIAAFALYWISIVRGKTRPNRATWIILTVVGILLASSYYSEGARETIWVPLSYVIGPAIVVLLSIRYGEGGWDPLDKFSLIGTLLTIPLWILSGSALLTLIINIFIDFLGILPTIKKSYLDPSGEDTFAWGITALSGVLNMFAIVVWSFSIVIYPLYLLIVNGLIFLLLAFPNFKKKHN